MQSQKEPITFEELIAGTKLNETLIKSGVPIIEHAEAPNLLQMGETQRVHKYNDLRALQMLLEN